MPDFNLCKRSFRGDRCASAHAEFDPNCMSCFQISSLFASVCCIRSGAQPAVRTTLCQVEFHSWQQRTPAPPCSLHGAHVQAMHAHNTRTSKAHCAAAMRKSGFAKVLLIHVCLLDHLPRLTACSGAAHSRCIHCHASTQFVAHVSAAVRFM